MKVAKGRNIKWSYLLCPWQRSCSCFDHIQTSEVLQLNFSLKTHYLQSCNNDHSHDSFCTFRHNVFPVSTYDVLDEHLFGDSREFDIIQVIKHKLTMRNFIPASKCTVLMQTDSSNVMEVSDCAIMSDPMTCGAGVQQATKVINQPDLFFVGYISNSTIGYTPNLDKENNSILINSCMYKLSGIVYLKSHHYWCEVYSTQKGYKKGWYVYNGLWNSGRASFVGPKPLFLEKDSLYLLMFERVATQSTFTSGVTFNRPNCSNDNLVVKQIIEVHKNLLMLRDNKASRTNIMAILQHYNIPAQKSNKKIGDLNELLLKHCHSFLSVPITFVPDCSIENYSEAPEQKKSTLPDKQLNEFVPVAFENDSMVSLVKTQENEAETPEN